MKTTIKLSTLALIAISALGGGYIGAEYTKLYYGIKDTPKIEQNMDSAELPSEEYKRIANNINQGN